MIQIVETSDPSLLAGLNKFVQEWHAARYPSIFKPYERDAVIEVFNAWLKDENVFNFVAYYNNDAAGYVVVKRNITPENAFQKGREVYLLDQIAVLPAFRNKGIAQLLIQHIINVAKSEGIKEIVLDHWSENTVAKSLFLKIGFKNYREQMYLKI